MDLTQRTILGRTGLSVSRLGLAGGYGVPADAVERAYHEYGVNYFYWSTFRKPGMGQGLRNLIPSHRDDMVIVLQSYDHMGITLKWAVRRGLKQLGVEYVDAIMLGWFNWMPPQRLLDQAQELKEAGLVKQVAMSGHNRKLFGKLARREDSPIDIFMVRYNAAHPGAEVDIYPHMTGDKRPGSTVYTATCWRKLLNPKKMPPGEQPLSASDCYRFVLSNPHVDLCMTGPASMEQMQEGFQALQQGPLSEDEMTRIREIGHYVHG